MTDLSMERPTDGAGAALRLQALPTAGPGLPHLTVRAPVVRPVVFDVRNVAIDYGDKRALDATTMKIYRQQVTAIIGPSGCGKSTFIRSLNRMNDSIPVFSLERADPLPRS